MRDLKMQSLIFKLFSFVSLFWNSIFWKSSSPYNSILPFPNYVLFLPHWTKHTWPFVFKKIQLELDFKKIEFHQKKKKKERKQNSIFVWLNSSQFWKKKKKKILCNSILWISSSTRNLYVTWFLWYRVMLEFFKKWT